MSNWKSTRQIEDEQSSNSAIFWARVIIAAVLFVVAIAASCSTFPPMPDHVDMGATRYAAHAMIKYVEDHE